MQGQAMVTQRSEPNRESVWDYPRPPRAEPSARHLVVEFAGQIVAETRSAIRILETSQPPTYYIPPNDVAREYLIPSSHHTLCEFKGRAAYYSLRVADRLSEDAAWYYPAPTPEFERIGNYLAFYPSRVDACYVDGERVRPQAGDFYGGWITTDIVGPFKGAPGTEHW